MGMRRTRESKEEGVKERKWGKMGKRHEERAGEKNKVERKWRGAMILVDDFRGENDGSWAKEIFENLGVTSCLD